MTPLGILKALGRIHYEAKSWRSKRLEESEQTITVREEIGQDSGDFWLCCPPSDL